MELNADGNRRHALEQAVVNASSRGSLDKDSMASIPDRPDSRNASASTAWLTPGRFALILAAGIFAAYPDLRFETRGLRVGDDFAVCEWTARTGDREWDGVDVFPLRDGLILRKDVYSSSHRPREL